MMHCHHLAFSCLILLFYCTDFVPFAQLAFDNLNVSEYSEPPLSNQFAAIAESVRQEIYNASYTMIGDNINILRNVFQDSKEAGKTWQIWGGATSKLNSLPQSVSISSSLTNARSIYCEYSDGTAAWRKL